jgi:hypothetical protein
MKWMLGTWKGAGKTHFIRTIVIDSVSGHNFSGTRTIDADDRNQTKIITLISGSINKGKFDISDGKILYKKEPKHGKWLDCTNCPLENNIIIAHDSIFLSSRITGCREYCDGTSNYYKLLCDYDTTTQRYLVTRFGSSSNARAFNPCAINSPLPVASKNNQDSLKNAESVANKKRQQLDDSLKIAANIAEKKQQRVNDSLQIAANIEREKKQQQVEDSLKTAAINEKKRKQQVDDSLKIAANIARKRQQQVNDSLQIAANIQKKKRQQQVEDSLKTVAIIEKKRKQQADDSLKIAMNIAKTRQQEIQDSLKNVANISRKKQQQVDDSLKTAAIIASKKQKQADDSLKIVAANSAKRRQQEIQDSLKNAASITKMQNTTDSVAATKPTNDKSKALEQRDNVLLQTYHITTPDILIELFDNAQLDGDRVSVYHNNTLIVDNKTLLKEPITLTVLANSANREHTFILVAENLGSIAPNTALMRITAGNQVYKLSVRTDLQTNAKIVFYYDGN